MKSAPRILIAGAAPRKAGLGVAGCPQRPAEGLRGPVGIQLPAPDEDWKPKPKSEQSVAIQCERHSRGTVGGPNFLNGGQRRLALAHVDRRHTQNDTATVGPSGQQAVADTRGWALVSGGWDSNPRSTKQPTTVFETGPNTA